MLNNKEIAKIAAHKRLRKVLLAQREILDAAKETPGDFRLRFTIAEIEAVYEAAGGKCAICKSDGSGRKLMLDHCHNTGKLRGLLCYRCNTGIGMFGDRIEVIQAAIAYLSR